MGLISTSPSPAADAKIIVPITSPTYSLPLKITGERAYIRNPIIAITGIALTIRGILNLCEKKENIRSIKSCKKNAIKTNSPSRVKEILYVELKVENSIGERHDTQAIVMFER
jgi:hypothetical protein